MFGYNSVSCPKPNMHIKIPSAWWELTWEQLAVLQAVVCWWSGWGFPQSSSYHTIHNLWYLLSYITENNLSLASLYLLEDDDLREITKQIKCIGSRAILLSHFRKLRAARVSNCVNWWPVLWGHSLLDLKLIAITESKIKFGILTISLCINCELR